MSATLTGTGVTLYDSGESRFVLLGTNLVNFMSVHVKNASGDLKFHGILGDVVGGTKGTAVVTPNPFSLSSVAASSPSRMILEGMNITVQNPDGSWSAPLPVQILLLAVSES